jgi:hypothetical protein
MCFIYFSPLELYSEVDVFESKYLEAFNIGSKKEQGK